MTWLAENIAKLISPQSESVKRPTSFGKALLAFLVACFCSLPAAAQDTYRRVALVIGNSDYVSAPALPNPRNDALAMSDGLRRLGFAVQEGIDLDAAGMTSILRTFGGLAETADVAVVFYAGHGIQVDGQNYMLPVDVSLERERDLNYEAVSLDLILSEVSQARKLAVVILDACRDNPFAGQLQASMGPTRSTAIGRGLGQVDAPADTLVAFATRDGSVAEDGTGINSPFTSALIAHLGEPGVEIGHYFRKVRDTVVASTSGRQEPFVYGSLSAEQFYLNPPSGAVQVAAAPTRPIAPVDPVQSAQQTALEADMLFWRSIEASGDAADYDAYLSRFPDGVFAELARNRVNSAGAPITDRGPQEVAAAVGNFGAVAMSIANWRRVGMCVDLPNAQAAADCAMAKCGHNYCRVHLEFTDGQCAAAVAGHFGTGETQRDAMDAARKECWRESGRQSDDCRRRSVSDCNS